MSVLLSCYGHMHWRQLRLLFGQPTSCGLWLDFFYSLLYIYIWLIIILLLIDILFFIALNSILSTR